MRTRWSWPMTVAGTRRTVAHRLIRAAGVLVFLVGAAGILLRAFVFDVFLDGPRQRSTLEVPLAGINGLGQDAEGRIYVGTADYYRVQVYSPRGEFLYGLSVAKAVGEGGFTFRVRDDGTVQVHGVRTESVTTFGAEGIQSAVFQVKDSPFKPPDRLPDRLQAGSVLEPASRLLCPRIVRRHPDGSSVDVVRQSALLCVLKVPFPSLVLAGAPVLVWWVVRQRSAQAVGSRDGKGDQKNDVTPSRRA